MSATVFNVVVPSNQSPGRTIASLLERRGEVLPHSLAGAVRIIIHEGTPHANRLERAASVIYMYARVGRVGEFSQ